jgi:thiosulfate/3-mercaptopyruvate sulfurtransferase
VPEETCGGYNPVMTLRTLIDGATLANRLGDPGLAIVDCRFRLDDVGWAERQYVDAHIPGAVYADLDRDLSGAKDGRNGRHPLPAPETLAATLGRLGIGPGIHVVAYDEDTGAFASRLWWLLRWMGHEDVAVLDGGFAAWQTEQRPTRAGRETAAARTFVARPRPRSVVDVGEVTTVLSGAARARLVDARAPERFRGDVEPLDRAAGHIPGAANHFFKDNLDETGRFLPADLLRTRFDRELAGTSPEDVIMYCGSGVTACHNLLAMEHAGLSGARLYAGSWSEWSSAPDRPVATGAEP